MLQFLRGHASSWVIKILLGLIVLSFGVWGVSGLFVGRGNQILVAKVGKVDISKQFFLHEIQKRLQAANREMKGVHLTLEQAVELGLPEKILDDLVRKSLLEQELDQLKLSASPHLLTSMTREDPAFKNEQGRFDGERFKAFLKHTGLTESQYLAHRAYAVMEAQFLTGITSFSRPSGFLSLRMFNDLFQERSSTIYRVNEEALAKITPKLHNISSQDLKAFYTQHLESYKTPEKREFVVLSIHPTELERRYNFSQKEIREAYEQRIDNYAIPEKRDLLVYSGKDRKKATEISELMIRNKPLPKNSVTTFHKVGEEELADRVGDKAFSLKEGQTSEVFEGDNAEFQVVKVLKIRPSAPQPLSQVHTQVIADMRRQKAMDDMAALIQTIEDAISSGASLEEIAKTHHLSLIHAPLLTANAGDSSSKTKVGGLQSSMIKTAFEQSLDETGPVVELEDGSAYVVRVTQVIPQHIQPLESLKNRIEEGIVQERLQKAIDAKIEWIFNKGEFSIKHRQAIAKDPSVQTFKVPTMTFLGLKEHPDVTQEIRSILWALSKDQGGRIVYKNRPAVISVDAIKPANASKNLGDYASLKNEVAELLNRDILLQYFNALKEKHGVTIYEDVLSNLTETV